MANTSEEAQIAAQNVTIGTATFVQNIKPTQDGSRKRKAPVNEHILAERLKKLNGSYNGEKFELAPVGENRPRTLERIFYLYYVDINNKNHAVFGRSFIFDQDMHSFLLNTAEASELKFEIPFPPKVQLPELLSEVADRESWCRLVQSVQPSSDSEMDYDRLYMSCLFSHCVYLFDGHLDLHYEDAFNHSIWYRLIDTPFIPHFVVRRSEAATNCGKEKYRQNDYEGLQRYDAIFRLHGSELEIGALEVKRDAQDQSDYEKLGLLMRDMLASICRRCSGSPLFRKIYVFGFQCTGNSFRILTMNSPRGNICVLNTSPKYTVPMSYSDGSKMGPLIQAILQTKDLAVKMTELLSGPDQYAGTNFEPELITFTLNTSKDKTVDQGRKKTRRRTRGGGNLDVHSGQDLE